MKEMSTVQVCFLYLTGIGSLAGMRSLLSFVYLHLRFYYYAHLASLVTKEMSFLMYVSSFAK